MPFALRWLVLRFLLFFLLASSACAGSQKDFLVVVKDGKYGYIDDQGNVVIQPQFIWADDFWNGLGQVFVCGRYVSIDASGTFYPLQLPTESHLVVRQKGDKFGFVDGSEKFIIEPAFDDALPFSEGFAAVKRGDKWGFIDTHGRIVIEPQFKAAFYFREGLGTVQSDSGDVLIDTSGKVISQAYSYLQLIAEGRVPVARTRDWKWGYLDLSGKVVIPLIFDEAGNFSEGLARVEKDKRWGYVDLEGKIVIPPQFDEAGEFGSGLAPVKLGEKTGFIDKSGKFAFLLDFDQAAGFLKGDEKSNLFIAPATVSRFWTKDGKFGYVNTSGRVIWGPVEGSPSHQPLLGWSEEDTAKSCQGVTARPHDASAVVVCARTEAIYSIL
ncbi:MAG TPA: WG repeat-containing protein [Candidatus Angelobacter sp.]